MAILSGRHDLRRWIADRTAPLMFALALTFLACQSVLVVLWFDVPNFSENALVALDPESPRAAQMRALLRQGRPNHLIQDVTLVAMSVIWPIIIAEVIFHWLSRPWNAETRRHHFLGLLFCACPSLRLCARSTEMRERLWLPGLGWRQANKRLRRRLERRFSVPMIVIALMIMPVLLVDNFMKAQVAEYAWLRALLHIGTGVIWFAFAAEFILMLSVADKKVAYCKKHWVDIAIIVLPLISFLRSLRLLRAAQVTKMARVYRLRGTAVKALRALMLLEFFQRILHRDVDRSIAKLERQLSELDAQAKEIRRMIAKLERRRDEESDGEDGTPEAAAGAAKGTVSPDPRASGAESSSLGGSGVKNDGSDEAKPAPDEVPL